jgi:ABC-type phosphate transport system permease subunit
MITSNLLLLIVVFGFWGIWVLGAIIARRSWINVAAIIPWVMLLVGFLLNKVYDWSGTIMIGVAHIAFTLSMLRDALRRPKPKDGS